MPCLGIKTKQAFVIQTQLGVFSLWSNFKKQIQLFTAKYETTKDTKN